DRELRSQLRQLRAGYAAPYRSAGRSAVARVAPRYAGRKRGRRRKHDGELCGAPHLFRGARDGARQRRLEHRRSLQLEGVKACLLRAPAPLSTNPLAMAEILTPEPLGDQILVRVKACGVC